MATRQVHLIREYQDATLAELLADLASDAPIPGGGSAAAVAAAIAAATLVKAARRSRSHLADADALAESARRLREQAVPLVTIDAANYAEAIVARRHGSAAARAANAAAAGPPVRIAEVCAAVADLAADVVADGSPEVRVDALTALRLAAAAGVAAADLAIADDPHGAKVGRANAALEATRAAAARVDPPMSAI